MQKLDSTAKKSSPSNVDELLDVYTKKVALDTSKRETIIRNVDRLNNMNLLTEDEEKIIESYINSEPMKFNPANKEDKVLISNVQFLLENGDRLKNVFRKEIEAELAASGGLKKIAPSELNNIAASKKKPVAKKRSKEEDDEEDDGDDEDDGDSDSIDRTNPQSFLLRRAKLWKSGKTMDALRSKLTERTKSAAPPPKKSKKN